MKVTKLRLVLFCSLVSVFSKDGLQGLVSIVRQPRPNGDGKNGPCIVISFDQGYFSFYVMFMVYAGANSNAIQCSVTSLKSRESKSSSLINQCQPTPTAPKTTR